MVMDTFDCEEVAIGECVIVKSEVNVRGRTCENSPIVAKISPPYEVCCFGF